METHDSQSRLRIVFGKKLRKDLHGQRRRFGISGSGGECERPTLSTNARASTPKSGESAAFVPGPHHSSRPVLSTTPVRVHTSHHTQRSGRHIRAGHLLILKKVFVWFFILRKVFELKSKCLNIKFDV